MEGGKLKKRGMLRGIDTKREDERELTARGTVGRIEKAMVSGNEK